MGGSVHEKTQKSSKMNNKQLFTGGVDSSTVVCARTQSFGLYVQPLQVPRYVHVPASKQPL